ACPPGIVTDTLLEDLVARLHPWGWVVLAALVIAFGVSRIPEVRNDLEKFLTMGRNYVGVDYGWRRLFVLVALSAGLAYPSARKLAGADVGHGPFVRTFITVAGAIFLFNLATGSPILIRFFQPGVGLRWRRERKIQTAGIINRITVALKKPQVSRIEVQE